MNQPKSAPSLKDAARPKHAVMPDRLGHVVLNVRDLDASHRFYTEVIGLKLTGEWRARQPNPGRRMRFYSGAHGGESYHHDLALVENQGLPPRPETWNLDKTPQAINHIAIMLPDRDAWLAQLEFLQTQGVAFNRRVNHGMAHSVYIADPDGYGVELLYELPREVWESGIDDALNFVESLPLEGDAALKDPTDVPTFGKP